MVSSFGVAFPTGLEPATSRLVRAGALPLSYGNSWWLEGATTIAGLDAAQVSAILKYRTPTLLGR
jgi:hypothetical protein